MSKFKWDNPKTLTLEEIKAWATSVYAEAEEFRHRHRALMRAESGFRQDVEDAIEGIPTGRGIVIANAIPWRMLSTKESVPRITSPPGLPLSTSDGLRELCQWSRISGETLNLKVNGVELHITPTSDPDVVVDRYHEKKEELY